MKPLSAAVVAALVLGLASSPAAAQAAAAAATPGRSGTVQTQSQAQSPAAAETLDAERIRQQFIEILQRYPPAVGRVLKNDPGLMSNDAYLQPYPALATFIAQHPQVKRNPSYFLESVSSGSYEYPRQTTQSRMWDDMMTGLAVFFVVSTILMTLGWIVRTLIDYRRWHRLSKIQSDAHTKLLDRFTANDELLAYVQSSAGSRFLQSAPIALDPGGRGLSAPFGRILWSIQAGLVLAAAGLGLYWVSGRVGEDATQPLFTMGVLGLSVGGGFVLSALVSYMLSKRLGLFDPPTPAGAAGDLVRRENHGG